VSDDESDRLGVSVGATVLGTGVGSHEGRLLGLSVETVPLLGAFVGRRVKRGAVAVGGGERRLLGVSVETVSLLGAFVGRRVKRGAVAVGGGERRLLGVSVGTVVLGAFVGKRVKRGAVAVAGGEGAVVVVMLGPSENALLGVTECPPLGAGDGPLLGLELVGLSLDEALGSTDPIDFSLLGLMLGKSDEISGVMSAGKGRNVGDGADGDGDELPTKFEHPQISANLAVDCNCRHSASDKIPDNAYSSTSPHVVNSSNASNSAPGF